MIALACRSTHRDLEAHLAAAAPDGRRCECTVNLEFDHVKPFAHGGEANTMNIRMACKQHNLLYAKDAMGKEFVESHFEFRPRGN